MVVVPHRDRDTHLGALIARYSGPLVILLAIILYAVLWKVAEPAATATAAAPFPGPPDGGAHDGPDGGSSYLGQFLGAESILLLSISLILISTLQWVDRWFDGIDRAAIWHRRAAIAGCLLLIPHMLLAHGGNHSPLSGPLATIGVIGLFGLAVWALLPRWRFFVPRRAHPPIMTALALSPVQLAQRILGGYDRWRLMHRLVGLFVAAGFIHGLLAGSMFGGSPVLRWTYVAIGGTGLAFYAYRELLARRFQGLKDYRVDAVRDLGGGLTEIALEPLGPPLIFAPGQFALIYIETKEGWHRHPFSIASGAGERVLRVTIKALGDYTSRVQELVEAGMPAVVDGPYGRFDRRRGTRRQLWIGAGVGVVPFMSWVRSLEPDGEREVDFFHVYAGTSPFASEIEVAAAKHPDFHARVVDSTRDAPLTPAEALAGIDGPLSELTVFMCGPGPMLSQFERAFRRAGVRHHRIHREHFDWR
ncbi:MAG: ferredoxin reductase family protein [Gaiellales bacterium]